MKKVLVTGANGCVGHYVVDELLQNPEYELYLLVRTPSKLREDIRQNPRVKLVVRGLEEIAREADTVRQMDLVVHLAAAWSYDTGNFEHAVDLFKLIDPDKCQKVIYFSTASILDENNRPLPEALSLGTPYISSKYRFHEELPKLPIFPKVVTLFPTWVFGGDSRHPHSHAAEGLKEVHKWAWLLRFFTVDASFHFIHAADMAKITKYLLENETKEKEYVLGNPLITAQELIKQISDYYHQKIFFQIPISLPLVLALAKILRKQIQPWDRYCLEKRHFRHQTVNCASFGLTSDRQTVSQILDSIRA